jgi:hypothetical protein
MVERLDDTSVSIYSPLPRFFGTETTKGESIGYPCTQPPAEAATNQTRHYVGDDLSPLKGHKAAIAPHAVSLEIVQPLKL